MITTYIKLEPIGPFPLAKYGFIATTLTMLSLANYFLISKPWSGSFIFYLNHSTLPSTSVFTILHEELPNVHVTISKTLSILENTHNFHRPNPIEKKKLVPIPQTYKKFEN
jgi:hypothetical protein